MTYTLIDIPSGTIIHCETYTSALRVRDDLGRGFVVSDHAPNIQSLINAARTRMDNQLNN